MIKRELGYSTAEEIANSASHGLGLLLSVFGLYLLLDKAFVLQADTLSIVSYIVYAVSLILLYLASTLYHAIPSVTAKKSLKIFDHCAIYLLIAGTYTPFLLIALRTPLAMGLMAVLWGLSIIGIVAKIVFIHRFKKLSLLTYLAMGWSSLIVIYQLAMSLSTGGLVLLALGGVIYSLGVVFYVNKRIPYNHAIWHLFVLGGSICHFCAIYFYITPQ